MAASYSSSSGLGQVATTDSAFQSLEGKISSMQREYEEKINALKTLKSEGVALGESLSAFRQGKQLLNRKAAVLNLQLQQAIHRRINFEMQKNEAKTSITDLKKLLTCDTRLADPSHPENADQKGTEVGQVKANDDCEIVAGTLGDGRNKLARLLEECTQWEARRLASELPLRLLRRFNGWMEREIRKLTATLEEVQAEKSRLVHSNLRSKAPARLVSLHEAVLTLKRMLDKQRGIKVRVLEQVAGKQIRLETLRQKAQALDASLRAEEAIYMEMRAPKSLSPDVVRGSRLPAPDPSLPASPPAGPDAAMTTPVVITPAISCPTPAENWECPNPHGTRPSDDTEGTNKRKRMRREVQHPASRTEEPSDMQ